jgi:hypothetical protein
MLGRYCGNAVGNNPNLVFSILLHFVRSDKMQQYLADMKVKKRIKNKKYVL